MYYVNVNCSAIGQYSVRSGYRKIEFYKNETIGNQYKLSLQWSNKQSKTWNCHRNFVNDIFNDKNFARCYLLSWLSNS